MTHEQSMRAHWRQWCFANARVTPRRSGWWSGLSDKGFPVQHVRIVGKGLHSVEQVTGR